MFLRESTETKEYEKKSKFGKFVKYKRTKTLTHWQCDNCQTQFFKVRNGKYDPAAKSFCKSCISKIGINKLAGMVGYEAKIKNKFTDRIGKVIMGREGYPEIYIGKDYPYRKGGYTCLREHVFVMETHLKRRIVKGEIVHHIDGDKRNNSLENLYLTTVQEHNKLHAESESIIFELVKQRLVTFNRSTARYEISDKLKNLL
jgi:hypothetical protein